MGASKPCSWWTENTAFSSYKRNLKFGEFKLSVQNTCMRLFEIIEPFISSTGKTQDPSPSPTRTCQEKRAGQTGTGQTETRVQAVV